MNVVDNPEDATIGVGFKMVGPNLNGLYLLIYILNRFCITIKISKLVDIMKQQLQVCILGFPPLRTRTEFVNIGRLGQ